jgi:hypothetical protein
MVCDDRGHKVVPPFHGVRQEMVIALATGSHHVARGRGLRELIASSRTPSRHPSGAHLNAPVRGGAARRRSPLRRSRHTPRHGRLGERVPHEGHARRVARHRRPPVQAIRVALYDVCVVHRAVPETPAPPHHGNPPVGRLREGKDSRAPSRRLGVGDPTSCRSRSTTTHTAIGDTPPDYASAHRHRRESRWGTRRTTSWRHDLHRDRRRVSKLRGNKGAGTTPLHWRTIALTTGGHPLRDTPTEASRRGAWRFDSPASSKTIPRHLPRHMEHTGTPHPSS